MTKIIQRHDTAANWTAANPVLAAGEMGVETDTSRFKFGNGTSTWTELAYATSGSGGGGTQLTSSDGATSYSTLALGNNLVVDTGDIAWTNPAMSSNSQDGYVATASNSTGSNGEAIYRPFDKDTTTNDACWYTGSVSMPQWIMLECPEPVRVTSCMIKNEVYTPVNLKSGYIQGSNDGSSFDTLYTISNRANTTGLAETYTFENSKYYKYLRVYCTESYSSGVSIQEIEFKGFVKDPSAVPSLNVNLDELGNEVNTLASAVAGKQDKLTPISPIKIYTDDEQAFGVTAVNSTITVDKRYTSTNNSTAYLESKDKSLNLAAYDTWEFRTKLLFNTNTTTAEQHIIYSEPFTFNIYGKSQLKTYLHSNTTDLSYYSPTNIGLSSNKIYYFKVKFTGSQYATYYSTTGFDSMTKAADKSTTIRVKALTKNDLLFMRYVDSTAYGSTMYLEDTYFIGNGEVVWRAYDESKLGSLVITSDAPEVATTSSLGVVQPDGTSITVNDAGVISGQDVKTFTGYSDTGTLVLKSINGVLQWVAEG